MIVDVDSKALRRSARPTSRGGSDLQGLKGGKYDGRAPPLSHHPRRRLLRCGTTTALGTQQTTMRPIHLLEALVRFHRASWFHL